MDENYTHKSFNEEEIRPSKLMDDKEQYVISDRNFLLSQKDRWVFVTCPACGSPDSIFFGNKNSFEYVECTKCCTVYTNPRPSQELLHQFYATSQNYAYWNKHIFPATDSIRRERIFRPRAHLLENYLKKYHYSGGVFMEVGAAFGSFCQELAALNLFEQIIALEPTPDLAETCRRKGFNVIQAPIEEIDKIGIADVIAAFEVLEHLFAPSAFIGQCSRLLKPNGILYLSCPNVKGFDISTLRMLSNTFDHEHINYFHPASLSLLLETHGFEVLDVATPGCLDAEITRKYALQSTLDLSAQPFLSQVLVDRWEELGQKFQTFLAKNQMSSHMIVICKKK